MEGASTHERKKFSTPHEELTYLREQVAKKERELSVESNDSERERVAARNLKEYQKTDPSSVLAEEYQMSTEERDQVVLDLAPEEHDEKMGELLGILQEKGVRNALSVVEGMRDPHIEDDFHRFLRRYIAEGYPTAGIKSTEALAQALSMALYEIALPSSENDREKDVGHLLAAMEQFYAGMLSTDAKEPNQKNAFTFEIGIPADGEEVVFYIGVPKARQSLFEKQLLASFPGAKVKACVNDYNPFATDGVAVASYAKFAKGGAFPLKRYDAFENDPLNIILSSFSKLDTKNEGAAVQIMMSPAGEYYTKRFRRAYEHIQKGVPVKKATDIPDSLSGNIVKGFRDVIVPTKKKKSEESIPTPVDEIALEHIGEKIKSPIVAGNIRLVASAASVTRAEEILGDLESAFQQFGEPQGNQLVFVREKSRRLAALLHAFVYRLFSRDRVVPLSLRELTGLYHLSAAQVDTSRELRKSKAKEAPAPVGMPADGVLLGMNTFSDTRVPIYFSPEDRLRHLYSVGQTGTGKSSLLKNMIIQDIQNGEGVCFIDPHGNDVEDILAAVPEGRRGDVIYFDPSETKAPMGLNMLEYDRSHPEQKTFVVNEMLSIFQKLYGGVPESLGPIFEQYFRNATMLVIEDPATGSTLLDVSRVFADEQFRQLKLSRCDNPLVVQFWRDIAQKAQRDAGLSEIAPYVTSKFDVFLANEIMRPIVAQERSAFNFREIMDERKILLVNLSKGRLGDINAHLLGLIIVGKILMAALSRSSTGAAEAPPFYLYIDEFQNVTTPSISTILSEARKYKLSLTMAHQFIAQLDEKIRDSVFGNVGSKCVFRVGSDDAEYLARQFEPVFSAKDLTELDNRNAYLALLVDGKPAKPFNIETVPIESGDRTNAETLKQESFARFGRNRADVEKEIRAKYASMM
ncbi:hypothetical protein COU17_01620 [Candidatus Kaiserbacteria bacterium CG10_big_fil_rev_8_21_14_0_10_49_17]|uniref:Uncharacterized protein n=1 Tax=Candidatus Kaiserbacteria bacterium CG10_big_fil_rev_8_21_14_0_10_49_17 TaxID=1974609 RepID=A0A2M6WEH1_9BACT|nr:MAG: hypothetical protein COU17_01620 [Candidatus Kaiserbacteria bacterium CG10_big_fil_rev_8_21_14_0_10_49_17]